MTLAVFLTLAVASVVFALLMVLTKNPVHSVIFLLLTFFAIAGQYVLLNAQFLAVVHIIVYAGAVMVLFLFVLMLLNLNTEAEPRQTARWKVAAEEQRQRDAMRRPAESSVRPALRPVPGAGCALRAA